MAELFKNIYNEKFFDRFIKSVLEVVPDFDKNSFLDQIYDAEWESRELKQRMRQMKHLMILEIYGLEELKPI